MYKIKITNTSGTIEFQLIKDRQTIMDNSNTVTIATNDLDAVRSAFSGVKRIEILRGTNTISTNTTFDGFSSIEYLGPTYDEETQRFYEAMRVKLTKVDIVEQIQRLDAQINPIIDTDAMTLEEYKAYKLKLLSEQCTSYIYEGDHVTLSDGTTETFSFDQNDQADLQALSSVAMMNPTVELTWHSNGNPCRFYSAVDIIIIYQTLNFKLFRATTVCNALNLLIKQAVDKDEVDQYYWGCELPAAEQARVDDLVTRMIATINTIMAQFIPGEDEEESPTEEIADNDDEYDDGGYDDGEE